MKKKRKKSRLCILSALMLLVILDSRTAVDSVLSSIEICMKTVIPGVFPFLFLGSAIAMELRDIRVPMLEKLLRIPKGTAGFFLMGLLCGYPVGAKLLQDAADRNSIDRSSAARMVCFCNNASPAFIIGILASAFSNAWIAICMWMIQIVTSFLLGIIVPGGSHVTAESISSPHQSIGSILYDALKAMASICGWVIIFGMILTYVNHLIFSALHPILRAILNGSLELTNGIFALESISSEAIRFIISGILLSFGGLCVLLQTTSVAPDISYCDYIQSRLLHAGICAALASIASLALFPMDNGTLRCIPLLLCAAILGTVCLIFNKKMVAIRAKV